MVVIGGGSRDLPRNNDFSEVGGVFNCKPTAAVIVECSTNTDTVHIDV